MPSPSPTALPTPQPTPPPEGHVPHPTEPTAVVLRMERAGGFVPWGFSATQVPQFTLYGDGTVIYQPVDALSMGGGNRLPPLRVARMNEEQISALLRYALGPGALEEAVGPYRHGGIADAPTTRFDIDAAGITKSVEVYALGESTGDRPDAALIARMAGLSNLLLDFGAQVAAGRATDLGEYVPERYRASLLEQEGAPGALPWPWPELAVSDFKPAPDFGAPRATITPEQAEKLAPKPYGGVVNTIVSGPDGKTYAVAIRPLLPGEES